MASEMMKKGNDCGSVDVGVRMKAEQQADAVSAGRDDQDGNRGHFSVRVGPLAEDGRLTQRGPCPAHERRHQDPALVEEEQRCA